jgi:hypothetical protein
MFNVCLLAVLAHTVTGAWVTRRHAHRMIVSPARGEITQTA